MIAELPLQIRADVLEQTRIFFEKQGSSGFEGTAMLAGDPARGATRCLIPDQRPYGVGEGVGIEVTAKGKLQLASGLALNERFLARIHSHPGEAFHSYLDDCNPALTAEGCLSIVVPFYGLGLRRGLEACAVFVYSDGTWKKIHPDQLYEYAVTI